MQATHAPTIENDARIPSFLLPAMGYFPLLALTSSAGVLLIASADNGARSGTIWADLLFWEGLLLLFVPIAQRLFSPRPTRAERIALVVLLGAALYMVKALHSPIGFTFSDELAHWRTAYDIAQTHHLFTNNALLPVSPYYPGLEITTNAISTLTGFSTYDAGILLLGVVRVMFALALFLLLEQISRSSRIAGVAALLYMTNNNFIFFSAQFAYESLALPLATTVLYLIVRRVNAPKPDQFPLTLAALLCMGAVLVTHHLTSYMLVAFLVLWAVIAWLARLFNHRQQQIIERLPRRLSSLWVQKDFDVDQLVPTSSALLMLTAGLSWMLSAATLTVRYLAQPAYNGIREFAQMILGAGQSRQLFQDFSGLVAPVWQRIAGVGALGLVLLAIPIGLWVLWRARRVDGLMLTCAVIAAAYPFTQALRFSATAWEIASRLSEFMFVVVAVVIAIGLVDRLTPPTKPATKPAIEHAANTSRSWFTLRRGLVFSIYSTILLLGGLSAGWPHWARMPGGYLVSADTRSVEIESISAAQWVGDHLPATGLLGADRVNRLLMGTYGKQTVITNVSGGGNVGWVYLSPFFGIAEKQFLQDAHVHYLVFDRRLTTGLPVLGIYFERGEPDTYQHKTPLDPAQLQKISDSPDVKRRYDSGNIAIYDVGGLTLGQ